MSVCFPSNNSDNIIKPLKQIARPLQTFYAFKGFHPEQITKCNSGYVYFQPYKMPMCNSFFFFSSKHHVGQLNNQTASILKEAFNFPHREETLSRWVRRYQAKAATIVFLSWTMTHMTDYIHYAKHFRGQAIISAGGAIFITIPLKITMQNIVGAWKTKRG